MVRIYRPQFGSHSRSAHLGTISVKESWTVSAGQRIGTLGIGGSDNDRLRFDIMHKHHATARFSPHSSDVGGLAPVVHAKNGYEAALTLEYFQDPLLFMAHRPTSQGRPPRGPCPTVGRRSHEHS